MKNIVLLSFTLILFVSCTSNEIKNKNIEEQTPEKAKGNIIAEDENNKTTEKDNKEIQELIRNTLTWSNSKNKFDILPVISDDMDSIYVAINVDKQEENINILRQTNLFSAEFIENYNNIILTISEKLIGNEFDDDWFVGEMPPFDFVSGVNPWCLCQDIPYDNPNPWDYIEIEIIDLKNNSGEIYWKWGDLNSDLPSDWIAFSYKFKVVKEDNKWKISYLQGFDFNKVFK